MRENRTANSKIPLWLKVAWTVWLLVWAPIYWRQYGAQNFLYFCDVGNFLIAIGLWTESRLILSWQAVGLLVFQTLYTVDLMGAALSGHHVFGGTEYMFDRKISLLVRLLGLYHLVVPRYCYGRCVTLVMIRERSSGKRSALGRWCSSIFFGGRSTTLTGYAGPVTNNTWSRHGFT